MAAKYSYEQVVKKLSQSPTNISCKQLAKMLEDLGFEVIRGTKGNHHRYKHPGIPLFYGGKFDCQPKLKPCYPRDVLTVLSDFETELNPKGAAK